MKVIILGAGQVGASVAEGLVSEENDITVVDYDGPRLALLQDRLDLRTVVGDAATPSVLRAGRGRRCRHDHCRDAERSV
jgi:trk system potassium uptake protein TrkA